MLWQLRALASLGLSSRAFLVLYGAAVWDDWLSGMAAAQVLHSFQTNAVPGIPDWHSAVTEWSVVHRHSMGTTMVLPPHWPLLCHVLVLSAPVGGSSIMASLPSWCMRLRISPEFLPSAPAALAMDRIGLQVSLPSYLQKANYLYTIPINTVL